MSMKLSQNEINSVLDDMYGGIPAYRSLRERNITPRKFFDTLQQSPELLSAFALAQEACAESLAGEIIDISDNETDPQRARNRVDARKWYASKLRPSKFGDRIDVNVTQIVDIGAALAEAKARIELPMRYPNKERDTQVIEVTDVKVLEPSGSKPDDTKNNPSEKASVDIFD